MPPVESEAPTFDRIANAPAGPGGYHDHVMAHFEIVAALIAFFGLLLAWFAVPSSVPVYQGVPAGADVTTSDAVPSAA